MNELVFAFLNLADQAYLSLHKREPRRDEANRFSVRFRRKFLGNVMEISIPPTPIGGSRKELIVSATRKPGFVLDSRREVVMECVVFSFESHASGNR